MEWNLTFSLTKFEEILLKISCTSYIILNKKKRKKVRNSYILSDIYQFYKPKKVISTQF